MKSDLVDIEAKFVAETEKAICIRLDETSPKVWLPLSAVEVEYRERGRIIVTMRESFAIEKELI